MNPVVMGIAIVAGAASVVASIKIISDACTSDKK